MSWPLRPPPHNEKPLPERIAAASRELQLARRVGDDEWIAKAVAALDALIDEIPLPEA